MSSSEWLPPQPYQSPSPPPQPAWKRLGGLVVAAGLLILKFGKFALIGLKGAKFLTTSASMLVSVGAYALIWGWPFAAGFVALLFLHELGHYIQLRREGVQPSGMLFIPFLGAVVGARSLGGSALAEARVGLAGPVLGSLAAGTVAVAGFALESDFLKALAFTGLFLNLFNLLPIVPLDGGRAMAAMAPWMWFAGLFVMVGLVFLRPNPVLILIALVGAFEVYRRWKQRKGGEEGNPAYYAVSKRDRLLVGLVYVGLIAVLAVGMDLTHVPRELADAR